MRTCRHTGKGIAGRLRAATFSIRFSSNEQKNENDSCIPFNGSLRSIPIPFQCFQLQFAVFHYSLHDKADKVFR